MADNLDLKNMASKVNSGRIQSLVGDLRSRKPSDEPPPTGPQTGTFDPEVQGLLDSYKER